MMIRKIALTTVFALQAVCELAVAGPKIVDEEVTLRFSKDATAAEIYEMIGIKANRACENRAVYPHMNLSGEAQCRQQFIRDAVTAINRPALTALHRDTVGGDTVILAGGDPQSR